MSLPRFVFMSGSRLDLLTDIWSGQNISLVSRRDLDLWPEIEALKTTPQDPEWHAEGDVFIHTDMVLAECPGVLREFLTSPEQLYLSALLHDIAKPETTRYDDDVKHTIAPGHERIGGVRTRYLLRDLGLSPVERRAIADLVSTHHLVKRSVQNIDKPEGTVFIDRLAARVDTAGLYALELADMRGRIAKDRSNQIEIVELFRMLCEERNIFGKAPNKWIELGDVKEVPFEDEHCANYVVQEAHRRRLGGQLRDEYAARAFCFDRAADIHRKAVPYPADVIITVGIAGSGKSRAVSSLPSDYERISSDAERHERFGDETTQRDHGPVFQACGEKLKTVLRRGGKAVWDSTNIVPDLRSKITTLCHDYGAKVTLWVFDVGLGTAKARNRERDRKVPDFVIEKQATKFEWPLPEEAHEIKVFDD